MDNAKTVRRAYSKPVLVRSVRLSSVTANGPVSGAVVD